MTKYTPYEPNLKEIADRYIDDEDVQNLIYCYRVIEGNQPQFPPCHRCGHEAHAHRTPGSECARSTHWVDDWKKESCPCGHYRNENNQPTSPFTGEVLEKRNQQ